MKHHRRSSLVVLDAKTFGEMDLSPLARGFSSWRCHPVTAADEIAERIAGANVVVSNKAILKRKPLEGARELKLVCIAATGTNNVDLEAARALGVPVTNVPGYSTTGVVAHTLAMYFHLAHGNARHDAYTKSGAWCEAPVFTNLDRPWHEPHGRVWGIIGLGAIGAGVARAVRALGCEVVYHSPSGRNMGQPYPHLSLPELLAQAAVVSIHTPLEKHTTNLIDASKLHLMRRDAILINTSRGGIVNEADLAAAIDAGTITGAALDVLEREPPEKDNPLWRVKRKERLFVTPHIAGLSIESRRRLIREVALNIEAFYRGQSRNRVA